MQDKWICRSCKDHPIPGHGNKQSSFDSREEFRAHARTTHPDRVVSVLLDLVKASTSSGKKENAASSAPGNNDRKTPSETDVTLHGPSTSRTHARGRDWTGRELFDDSLDAEFMVNMNSLHGKDANIAGKETAGHAASGIVSSGSAASDSTPTDGSDADNGCQQDIHRRSCHHISCMKSIVQASTSSVHTRR